MKILIIGPALLNRGRGNRRTALRWGRILVELGHEVAFSDEYSGQDCNALIALHAIRSADSVRVFRDAYLERPVIVALTGTDIYGLGSMFDEAEQGTAHETMRCATRLVAFHPLAIQEVPESMRDKVRVIYQSLRAPDQLPKPQRHRFEVCVVGALHDVKDPFRTGLAARRLPSESTVRVLQAGAASSEQMAERATKEERANIRYNWLGELPHADALALIARSHLLSITSRHEGGANILTEALALHTPIVASRIAGNVGILGDDYPGYFEAEDTEALNKLLRRAETNDGFYGSLCDCCAGLAELASPDREAEAWKEVLAAV